MSAVGSVEELLAHALAMESEAAERYGELADQLEQHHNREVAQLFRRMAEIELQHVAHVKEMANGQALPRIKPWEYRWGAESPEAPSASGEVTYRIQPYEALQLALAHEKRAAAFYAESAAGASDASVRELAARLTREEEAHVLLLEQWLERCPAPAELPEDTDPPNELE